MKTHLVVAKKSGRGPPTAPTLKGLASSPHATHFAHRGGEQPDYAIVGLNFQLPLAHKNRDKS
jgi:hypothetical protein